MTRQQTYVRFRLAQRIEHIVLIASFTTLSVTGLAQKYAGAAVAEFLIKTLGGVETVRTIHHAAAVVFVVQAVYHLISLAYKVFVQHTELSMLPGIGDVTDALAAVRYNLGLTKQPPAYPRYSFAEKAEYWALIWGTVIMALTGFMLWNPIFITRLFPGEIIPAAKAAHGGEAVLAVLAIVVWHFYNVHIKGFNKSMWTGRMDRHEMAEEHGAELARLERGAVRPLPRPEVVRQRQRAFFPVAVPLALLLLGGIYWLTTFERTALPTLPATPAVVAFAPLPTPTLTPAAAINVALAIPHDVAGREQCDSCHGQGKSNPYPADHVGRTNESCQACHKPGPAPTAGAAAAPAGQPAPGGPADIPHPVQGREQCSMCHGENGVKPMPQDHAGRTDDTCTSCHKLSPGITGTPAPSGQNGSGQPAAGGAAAGGPPTVSHRLDTEQFKNCLNCHGKDKLAPLPDSHAGYKVEQCTACHRPTGAQTSAATGSAATGNGGTGQASGGAPAIPHDITGETYKDCTTCHGAGKMKPFPANHAGFKVDQCTTCHQPAAGGAATSAGAAGGAAAGGPPTVSHRLDTEQFKNCLNCHGKDKLAPLPDSHAGYKVEQCTACHRPTGAQTSAATGSAATGNGGTGQAPTVSHRLDTEQFKNCLNCHAADKIAPFPANHAGFGADTCTGCHQPTAAQPASQ